jgi:hypothetical protein
LSSGVIPQNWIVTQGYNNILNGETTFLVSPFGSEMTVGVGCFFSPNGQVFGISINNVPLAGCIKLGYELSKYAYDTGTRSTFQSDNNIISTLTVEPPLLSPGLTGPGTTDWLNNFPETLSHAAAVCDAAGVGVGTVKFNVGFVVQNP